MNKIFLALGGNVGDVKKSFEKAVELLSAKIKAIKMAPIYTSKAVGYTDQPDFFNTALVGYTELEPLELLKFVKDVEKQTGRQERFRWGPREVDIDIIFYNNIDKLFLNKNLDRIQLSYDGGRQRDLDIYKICTGFFFFSPKRSRRGPRRSPPAGAGWRLSCTCTAPVCLP